MRTREHRGDRLVATVERSVDRLDLSQGAKARLMKRVLLADGLPAKDTVPLPPTVAARADIVRQCRDEFLAHIKRLGLKADDPRALQIRDSYIAKSRSLIARSLGAALPAPARPFSLAAEIPEVPMPNTFDQLKTTVARVRAGQSDLSTKIAALAARAGMPTPVPATDPAQQILELADALPEAMSLSHRIAAVVRDNPDLATAYRGAPLASVPPADDNAKPLTETQETQLVAEARALAVERKIPIAQALREIGRRRGVR